MVWGYTVEKPALHQQKQFTAANKNGANGASRNSVKIRTLTRFKYFIKAMYKRMISDLEQSLYGVPMETIHVLNVSSSSCHELDVSS